MRAEPQLNDAPQPPCPVQDAPSQVYEAQFVADPLAVRGALRGALARFLRQITDDEAGTLELVLAEVFNNIVEHGYAGAEPGPIALRIERYSTALACAVADEGIPVPASCLDRGRRPGPPENQLTLPEGGFGWFLIHDLTSNLVYRREAERNLLAFRLPLSTG